MSWPMLLAQDGVVRTTFEWGRIQSNADWILPIAACVGLMLLVRYLYQRDAVEIHPALGWFLTLLRTAVVLGLLILFLQPQWRTEREVVRNSRAIVLVDTSLSMALNDGGSQGTRAAQVAAALEENDLVGRLRQRHDVVVFRFDEDLGRLASLDKHTGSEESPESPQARLDWAQLLNPRGRETRLGQALRQVVLDERAAPVSGIVVFSDGGQNAGLSPENALQAAQEAKFPLFTVGIGSTEQPASVRVYRLEAPPRAHPGDPYTVTGMIQGQQMAGQAVTVQLFQRPAAEKAADAPGTLLKTEQVVLGKDGEVVPVKFEIKPQDTGRFTLTLAVQAPPRDRNLKDNRQEADIEIAERRTRVLLVAGGPSREYQFLRNQLHRDRSATVDVLLQTAKEGISQDAATILDRFPATREEMLAYDCVVAFDPDWQALSTAEIDILERWVAEHGGGLIVSAGPVSAGDTVGGWVRNPALAKIRALYPVEFSRDSSSVEMVAATASDPWSLDFTREGLEAEFLWLAETASASRQAWAELGVYSHFPVRGPKPGAVVYATAMARDRRFDKPPVYFAGQYYGSGQVFFMGSSEMWRLRRSDPNYFDQFYTRLIRHVSQGRLLRQSSRGVLMLARETYLLGNTVEVRAQLTNAQFNPLGAPAVPMQVLTPSGAKSITLRAEPGRPGMYAGQVTVLEEGSYRLELPIPGSSDERLTRRIHVTLPDRENENPERNEKLLARLAEGAQGRYYPRLTAALASGDPEGLVAQLKDRSKTIILPESPNPLWEREWLTWLLIVLVSLLSLEWLLRRLWRLA